MREYWRQKSKKSPNSVAQSEGLELVEVEVKGGGNARLVRIAIDKPEGVTHGDCELVSGKVGAILDVEDIVPGGHYTLEVSSPGVERKLSKPQGLREISGARRRKSPCATRWTGAATWKGSWPVTRTATSHWKPNPARSVNSPFEQIQKANLKFEW